MIKSSDFDWDITRKDLVILIPNFKRADYIQKTINNLIKTSIPRDKWVVLVINDGFHESFEDLQDKNVYYFTFERSPLVERNGAFIRNIAIKRCQCNLLAQKDPEVLFTGDFIAGCFNNSSVLYRCGGIAHLTKQDQKHKFFNGVINEKELAQISVKFPILENQYVYFHYGHCVSINYFRKINGYDEDFTSYGPEDHDMYDRLLGCGLQPFFDKQCSPIHLYHGVPNTSHEEMKNVYKQKQKEGIIRNIGINWGEG
jgi:predicted glycosyltransferase involved in capsule biosynthesis